MVLHQLNAHYQRLSTAAIGHVFDANRDVVLITGGAHGLGHELARRFSALGGRVAVMDIEIPIAACRVPGVAYFQGDVCVPQDLVAIDQQIRSAMGPVTVLINNASVAEGGLVLDTLFAAIDRTVDVNLKGAMYATKVFLPPMVENKRGYIVNVALTLGYMCPARLAAYGATKLGVIAFHEGLTYELGGPLLAGFTGVKTLLVCPGQLSLGMFSDVDTPCQWLAPKLDPDEVAKTIVKAVKHGARGEIKMPFYGKFLPIFRSMPWPVTELARKVLGIDSATQVYVRRPHLQIDAPPTSVSSQDFTISDVADDRGYLEAASSETTHAEHTGIEATEAEVVQPETVENDKTTDDASVVSITT